MLVILPSANILAAGIYLLLCQLNFRGETRPFLLGFELAGLIAVALILIAKLAFDQQMSDYRLWAEKNLWAVWHEYVEWTGRFTLDHADGIRIGFDVLALGCPRCWRRCSAVG